MVKPILLSLAVILIMAITMACGGAEEDTTDTSEPAAPTTAAVSPTEEAMEEEATEAPQVEATEEPQTAATEEPEEDTSTQASQQEQEEETTTEDTMMEVDADLKAVADSLAGGPGALYVGDLNQLVGPVPAPIADDIGDNDGVPFEGLEDYMYVFGSDYYTGLVERANYTNPTEATTTGLNLQYQFACINRALTHCKLAEWWAEEVLERTNGQLRIDIIGYPELGIAGLTCWS